MAKKKEEVIVETAPVVEVPVAEQEEGFDFMAANNADLEAEKAAVGLAPVIKEPTVDPALEYAPSQEKVQKAQDTIAQEFDKTVEQKPARIQRKEENARKMLDFLAAKEEELGRKLTRQEIADHADSKGLWAYQSLYNKKGNWANAFGAQDVFGALNDDTYKLIRKDLDDRQVHHEAIRINRENPSRVIGTIKQPDGSVRSITRAHQTRHQNLWGEGDDINNMTPEKAGQFVDMLRASGYSVPDDFKVEGNTSMNDLLIKLMPYVDEDELEYEMRKLGYYDGDTIVAPHKETYDEMMARRARQEAEMKLQSQQKALARRQTRLGMADLAAGIGDMIKASGGAKVDPRDYKAMYDTLTQQQQANFNNYLARMKALEEAEKEKAERARQERLLAERYAREDAIRAEEMAWKEEQKELQRKHEMEKIAAKAAYELELKRSKYKGSTTTFKSKRDIVFGGVKYNFGEGSKNSVISGLLPIVRKYFTNENGYQAIITGIEKSEIDGYGKSQDKADTVISALKEFESSFSSEDKEAIKSILGDYSSKSTVISGGGNGGNGGNTGKKYKDASGKVISAAEYSKLSPSQKKLYTEVK